jgi:hypothetical protein
MLRIPGSRNSKSLKEGESKDSEVRIIQKWDCHRPKINLLLGSFYAYLKDKEVRKMKEVQRHNNYLPNASRTNNNIIGWIEKLFEIALEHNREYCVWRIFAPYLINVKKLAYNDAYDIIEGWLNRCNSMRNLDFDADYQIKYTLNNAMSSGYLPIASKNLKTEKPDLYNLISSVSIIMVNC